MSVFFMIRCFGRRTEFYSFPHRCCRGDTISDEYPNDGGPYAPDMTAADIPGYIIILVAVQNSSKSPEYSEEGCFQ